MNCSKCGILVKEGAKFCQSCGQVTEIPALSKNLQTEHIVSLMKVARLNGGYLFFLTILVLFLAVASGFGFLHFSNKNFKNKLHTVTTSVVQGEFDKAFDVLETLKDNKLSFAMNKLDLDNIKSSIDEHRLCVLNEYPTYKGHSGIAGCTFWMRHDDLEKKQVWISDFKKQEDTSYCNDKNLEYAGRGIDKYLEYADRRGIDTLLKNSVVYCDYGDFKSMKRKQNWDYLVSEEWDEFTEQCTLVSCPLPEELNF